jgi:hypothetical protein
MTQGSFVDAGACSVGTGQGRAEDFFDSNSSGTAVDIRHPSASLTIEATGADEFAVLEAENREGVAECRNLFDEAPSGDSSPPSAALTAACPA